MRNSAEQIRADIEHLQAMLENADHLHDKGYDIATTGYLVQQIQDWIDELTQELAVQNDLRRVRRIQAKAWVSAKISEQGKRSLYRHIKAEHNITLGAGALESIIELIAEYLPEELILVIEDMIDKGLAD